MENAVLAFMHKGITEQGSNDLSFGTGVTAPGILFSLLETTLPERYCLIGGN